jgi:hypothetical protein
MQPSALLRQARLSSAVWDRPLPAGLFISLICVNIIYLFAYELRIYPKLIYIAFVVSLFATFHIITRRALFSLFAATMIAFALAAFSLYKFNVQARTLHVADLFLMQVGGAKYLAAVDHGFAVTTGAAIVGVLTLGILSFRLERAALLKSGRAFVAAGICYLVLSGLVLFDRWYGSEIHNVNRYHVSAFLRSIRPMNEFYREHKFYAREPHSFGDYSWRFSASAGVHQPHVIYVLDESAFPFEPLVDFAGAEELAPKYVSANGRRYALGVEHFGAGTSLTELSMMSPLSTKPLGPFQWILPDVAMNRIHGTIMKGLNQTGYRSICVYPSEGDYFNFENFYMTIGFDDFIDQKDMNAPTPKERDKVYFDSALRVIKASRGPAFLSIVLSSNHFPWSEPLFPEVDIGGLDKIADADVREYVRRSLISQRDYTVFRQALQSASPDRDVIIVRYGDHQPALARKMRETAGRRADDGMYKTYVTFDIVSSDAGRAATYAQRLPALEQIDAPFVSTTVLSVLGLTNPVVETVNRIRDRNNGLYYAETLSPEVIQHEGSMIAAGLLQLKGSDPGLPDLIQDLPVEVPPSYEHGNEHHRPVLVDFPPR